MTFRRYEWSLILRVAFLFATITLASYLTLQHSWLYLFFVAPVILLQLIDFYRFHRKSQEEVEQFVESVRYRDFSRNFDVKQAPLELRALRKGFNDINATFKHISRERETQYQYLQKILELVDTGIISYEMETGEISWLNESFKRLMGIPYLKNIQALDKRDPNLYEEINSLKYGESKIVTLLKDKNALKALVTTAAFQTDGKVYKLVAFQNVNEALDETESKAWQRLLSVMTHEIMNSVAPISSLADTLKTRLSHSKAELPPGQVHVFEDLDLGIETIKRRSEGLLKFAETYRNLNKITKPNLSRVFISEMFENLHQLMAPTLEQKNIELEVILKDPLLTVEADINLIEQVLINLVVNAMDAVKEQPEPLITLSGSVVSSTGKVVLNIADNGTGMPEEVVDKIFIPFFSTKKNGSGIGLSLCKQIMMLHKGNIHVQSAEGEGTVFSLMF
ncbi:sensor histidine kinase [Deminuibacter soli]|uniref:histidine kinase n=1 Tax=Deminuibacter soli TaxID=2291815 RepID=A0A3E1NDH3_9BACT|nr:HAMP domain-containing sensor histidine kinase [Deminuibacter soli]RFM25894.1 sensor histidine kinase [Deminuibacter soli]